MVGQGLSFPVSEAVNGELFSAGNWAEANHTASDDREVLDRLGRTDLAVQPGGDPEVYHHGTSVASMV
jgi:hypothetical protein